MYVFTSNLKFVLTMALPMYPWFYEQNNLLWKYCNKC